MKRSSASLILASQSPRRAALMEQVGLAFEIVPATGDEPSPLPAEEPAAYALRTAAHKATLVQEALAHPEAWIIGADTIVVSDQQILGKPKDPAHAKAMLEQFSGRAHEVITAYAILYPPTGLVHTAHTRTEVWFRALTAAQIQSYIESGEPFDKAGAYGIQARAALFVARIAGCYFNVMGLPIGDLVADLRALGYPG